MNILRAYNISIAVLLIVIYLALPSTLCAYSSSMEDDVSVPPSAAFSTTTSPCDDCPCSGGQHSDCCDTTFCNCACHAPLGQGFQLAYTPMIAIQNFREPSWSLAQVYRTIFVPPQNLV
jgi:hypothetical protein